MALPSVTYTFVNGTATDAGQVNQNFTDIINSLTDTTKSLSIDALTVDSVLTHNGITALRGLFTNGANEITTSGLDNAKIIMGSGDDTEIYHDGTNFIIDPEASGSTTAFVINESGSDCDVRMEGIADANLFYLDASADKIGVGNTTPTYKLDISGTLRANGATFINGTLTLVSDFTVNTDKFVVTASNGNTEVDGTLTVADNIITSSDIHLSNNQRIQWGTSNVAYIDGDDGAGGFLKLYSEATLALTIDDNQDANFAGNVGVGGTPTLGDLHVQNNSADAEIYVQRTGTSASQLRLDQNSVGTWTANDLTLRANQNVAVTVTQALNMTVGAGKGLGNTDGSGLSFTSDRGSFSDGLDVDGANFVARATGGTDVLKVDYSASDVQIGDQGGTLVIDVSANDNKLGFYGVTPVTQPGLTGGNGYTSNAGNTVRRLSTFTGGFGGATAYTIDDIVQALKDVGIIQA